MQAGEGPLLDVAWASAVFTSSIYRHALCHLPDRRDDRRPAVPGPLHRTGEAAPPRRAHELLTAARTQLRDVSVRRDGCMPFITARA